MKLQFNKTCFIGFIIILITEVSIALLLKNGFVRETFGDYLVVILIYCFLRSFIKTKPLYLALGVLVFAFTIEFSQLYNILGFFHLQENTLAKVILGSTFQIRDLIAYTVGFGTILIVEYKIFKALYSKPST
ncbi:MAG TPA: DUF2809 domain-containing protein [Flavobacteriaceae bacterium]|nr:DUF2809 domain-containing protein [Flavobacteriaceae bacterium]